MKMQIACSKLKMQMKIDHMETLHYIGEIISLLWSKLYHPPKKIK